MVLIIDNYDGSANNIYQLIGQIEPNTVILHHDQIEPSQVLTMAPSHIVLSSGSGTPERAGSAVEIVRACAGRIPILGICLGCRIICAAYGGKITLMEQVEQGKRKLIHVESRSAPLFAGVPDDFYAGFYRSESIVEESIAGRFSVIARSGDDAVGIAHQFMQVYGLQFHPESFLSEYGKVILSNFLKIR